MTKKLARIKKQVLPTLKKYGVSSSYIFGSVSRGEERSGSDIDFLVTLPAGSSLLTLILLQQDLARLLKKTVDIVTPQGLSRGLREKIKPDLMRLL